MKLTGTAAERLAARARLYGPPPATLLIAARDGIALAAHAVQEIRLDDPGARDRLDRLALQLENAKRHVLTIRERITSHDPEAA